MFSANTTQAASGANTVADPYYATNTVFLMNFDNLANGTSIVSPDVTAKQTFSNTNVTVNTSIKKYGTGSGSFNGTSSYLGLTSNANLGMGSNPFTIEFWMYPTNVSGDRGIFSLHTTGGDNHCGIIINTTGRLKAWYRQTGLNNITGNTALVANTWYHVAVVKTADTTESNLRIYLNGVLEASRLLSTGDQTFNLPTVPAVLGRTYVDANQQYFAGYLDDVRVTKGIARYTAITAPYPAPPAGPFATS